MNRHVSPCNHHFLPLTLVYHSKETPINALHAEKIAKTVLLYVFRTAFPTSLFKIYRELEYVLNWEHSDVGFEGFQTNHFIRETSISNDI